jgi:hypothetical protein
MRIEKRVKRATSFVAKAYLEDVKEKVALMGSLSSQQKPYAPKLV